jgi:hypothetical protein
LLLALAFLASPAASFAGEAPQRQDCRQLASIDLDIGPYVLLPVTLDGNQARMGLTTAMGVSSILKQGAERAAR